MSSKKALNNLNLAKFWDVFIAEVPRVPTVDELICRVVAINYPEGIVRDRNGAAILPLKDAGSVTTQILFTLKMAIELEQDFWIKRLRQNKVFTPFGWGVRLSANIAITEAETQILNALQYVENIDNLDQVFWVSFRRTDGLCKQDSRSIKWAPFNAN